MEDIAIVILAAGQGTRMKSSLPKVLHSILGKPMLFYPLRRALELRPKKIVLVLGHQSEEILAKVATLFPLNNIEVSIQSEPLGTGHAVLQALPKLLDFKGTVVILYGDTPLLESETLQKLLICKTEKKSIAFITSTLEHPDGYGRVVRQNGRIVEIVEEKDCLPDQKLIHKVNAGIYAIDADFLKEHVAHLQNQNAQGEFYLTDLVKIGSKTGRLSSVSVAPEEIYGVNNRKDLLRAEEILKSRMANHHMKNGVTLHNPMQTWIEEDVQIDSDVEIYAGVRLAGKTSIGQGSKLFEGCIIENSQIGADCVLKPYTVITDSIVGDKSLVGPFAHLRPQTKLGAKTKIGNFVELKKTVMGEGSKASHLSYLGDAVIGRDVNIGCGVVTCNYDGETKHVTVIHDGVFVGSGSQLVAPVELEKNSYVAAGTTVTQNVPEDALAIARTPQVNIADYSKKRRSKKPLKSRI